MRLKRTETFESQRKVVRHAVTTALIIAFSTLLTFSASCNYSARAGIILAGSTSVQPFAEILAEAYMKLHPGISIDVQGGGSASGIQAASSGTADIGMSSRALSGDENKLWQVQIAKDGLALIVNPKNPVASLSLAQARDIYAGNLTRWNEVGGPNDRIHVVAREDGSGTRSAFESMVMGKALIASTAIIQDSNGAVRQLISSDPNAIGFLSLGLVDNSVKAVTLDGVKATEQNVVNGSYRLTRPFLFISRAEPTGEAKQFIDFTMSEAGRKILDAEGLVTSGGNQPK